MRIFVLVIAAAILSLPDGAFAQATGKLDGAKLRDANQIQPKMPGRQRNPCAEYGAGFVPVAGTSTCAKLGGSVSVGVGTGNGGVRSAR
jgi:hypothetical protein